MLGVYMAKYCLMCNKRTKCNKSRFCSQKCFKYYQYLDYIVKWKNNEVDGLSGMGVANPIRTYLFNKYNSKCQLCGWNKINPVTKLIPLEVHHIDGNYLNTKENNLQLLCPNCHALTENFKALNINGRLDRTIYLNRKNYCIDCNSPILPSSLRCKKCEGKRKTISEEDMKLSRKELKVLIRENSFEEIGRQYGVTGNTIKKWCKKYKLPYLRKMIKNYSNHEWDKI